MALEYPNDLKYLDTHEYVRLDGDVATVGITAFAVNQLGDIVFLELPKVGSQIQKGETFGTVESVKAVEDLKAPVTGTVLEANTKVVDAPEMLGEDPYSEGWLLKVQVRDASELDTALSAEDYEALVTGS